MHQIDPHSTDMPGLRITALVALTSLCTLFLAGCSDGSDSATRDVHTTRCITDVSAASRHEFLCDGVQFKVLFTQECIDAPCGLIFDVHGWLSNPDEQERRTSMARAAEDKGGYIVVQPGELTVPSSWNPDIHYDIVYDFMQQAIEAFDVDSNRVHFTGFSQGGLMTWKFVCDHSDVIASAAPLTAPELNCFLDGAGPPRKMPLFYMSGTRDVLVRYFSIGNRISVTDSLVRVMYDYGMVSVDVDDYTFSATGDLVVDDAGRIDTAVDGVQFEIVDGGQQDTFLWTRYTDANVLVFEHLRHDNNHVYPDNPDSRIFPEDPAVWFPVGEAILQFFIENPKR